jgi:hypothetical protein
MSLPILALQVKPKDRLPGEFKVKPSPQTETYLRTTVGELLGKLGDRAMPAGLHVCTRKDFRPHGFAWERKFSKAVTAQHCCIDGDGTRLTHLIPRSLSVETDEFQGSCEPMAVLGFF